MKKLYLLLLALLLIPTTSAVTPYGLDQPLPELNGYTLREVFENRNQGMPDLDGKTDLGSGNYRLYDLNGITIDYNIYNGEYKKNGVYNGASNTSIVLDNDNSLRGIVTAQLIYISGNFNLIDVYDGWRFANNSDQNGRINWGGIGGYTKTHEKTENTNLLFRTLVGSIYDNFTFKLQLEKGSIATPYQVPTSGPYSEFDFGTLDLTPKQMDMYYYYYLEAVQSENTSGTEFFLISIFFMYILIMAVGYFMKGKYFYFAGSLLWLVPIFNYQNIFIITTSIIVFLIHLVIIFYSDKDDAFE